MATGRRDRYTIRLETIQTRFSVGKDRSTELCNMALDLEKACWLRYNMSCQQYDQELEDRPPSFYDCVRIVKAMDEKRPQPEGVTDREWRIALDITRGVWPKTHRNQERATAQLPPQLDRARMLRKTKWRTRPTTDGEKTDWSSDEEETVIWEKPRPKKVKVVRDTRELNDPLPNTDGETTPTGSETEGGD